MNVAKPFFSIVTVCFRDKKRLVRTVESVRTQDFKDFEYIIIDGASDDGTSDEVANAGSLISKFVSEPDQGIYDAMNKGLKLAQGQYVLFLNAGDLLAEEKSLTRCHRALSSAGESLGILCPVSIKYPGFRGERIATVSSAARRWKGLPTSHQGIIYRLDVLKSHPFDTSLKLAADLDQYLRVTNKHGTNFLIAAGLLASVEAGGVSDVHRTRSRAEYKLCIKRHLGMPDSAFAISYQMVMTAYDTAAAACKFYLPANLIHSIRLKK